MKKFALGIDLHGTLLDKDWTIQENFKKDLLRELSIISEKTDIYICTGNDLSFVYETVPFNIINLLSGFILETGTVFSDKKNLKILLNTEEMELIKNFTKEILEYLSTSDFVFSANRIASISLFTKVKDIGDNPEPLFLKVKDYIFNNGLSELIRVTHSDVAVDIVPFHFNKFRGIKKICTNQQIISIADSFNDFDFIMNSDFSFVPNNVSKKITNSLKTKQKSLEVLKKNCIIKKNCIYKSSRSYTAGTLEILTFIKNKFL